MANDDRKLLETHEPLLIESPEEKLRAEIESLKHQLEEEKQKRKKAEQPQKPKTRTLWITGLVLLALLVLAFFAGWLPRHRRESELKKEAQAEKSELPKVSFVRAQRSPTNGAVLLPGTIEAETDSPVLARTDGYVRKRYVDIGDRVVAGQLMAELEAPDLDQQVHQGDAQLRQAKAAQRQADAALQQGKANEELARITAARWENLVKREAVSRQENDTYQANYQAQIQNVDSLVQARDAAAENVHAAEANFSRLQALQAFKQVRAPFDGIVTVRNIDTGALISTGNTLLFRVAQIDELRTYIYVAQPDVSSVQIGQAAEIYSVELGGHVFPGVIRRTASALDPTTRTLLAEVHVPNPQRILLPGMFVQVRLNKHVSDPAILIPGESLLVRANGTFVGVLKDYHKVPPNQQQQQSKNQKEGNEKQQNDQKQQSDQKQKSNQKPAEVLEGAVHLAPVTVGRDYGNAIEVYRGVETGQLIISNPNDSVVEGARVQATETQAQLDQVIAAPSGARPNASSENLQNAPGAEQVPKQPSVEKKTRGRLP